MGVQYFVCTYASFILGELPMSRMTGPYGRSINIFKSSFRSMKNCKDGSDGCCIPYTPIPQLEHLILEWYICQAVIIHYVNVLKIPDS